FAGQTPSYGFLSPSGAIFATIGGDVTQNTLGLFSGAQTVRLGSLNSFALGLRVSGDYAIWSGQVSQGPIESPNVSVYLTRLGSGVTADLRTFPGAVPPVPSLGNNNNDVTSQGVAVAWSSAGFTGPGSSNVDYNIIRFQNGMSSRITSSPGNIFNIYPRTDGSSYLYTREQVCCSTSFSLLVLNRNGVERTLRDGTVRAQPDLDYRITGGWV